MQWRRATRLIQAVSNWAPVSVFAPNGRDCLLLALLPRGEHSYAHDRANLSLTTSQARCTSWEESTYSGLKFHSRFPGHALEKVSSLLDGSPTAN